MEKPVSVIISEAKKEIVDVINNVQIHPAILEMIMKDLYREVQALARQQAETETAQYNEGLKEEEKNKKKE